MSTYVEVPASALREFLKSRGFEESRLTRGWEEVYDRAEGQNFVRVYSSISSGNDSARGCGKDAIRVVALAPASRNSFRSLDDPAGYRGIYKCKRVHRTGSVDKVLARLGERIEEAASAARGTRESAERGQDMRKRGEVITRAQVAEASKIVAESDCSIIEEVDEDAAHDPAPGRGEQPWLVGMNPEQLEAIMHGEGPLQMSAGAGSGKTRVVCHRIARLVHEGIDPARILAVTFANRAAGEMNERVKKLGVESARVGTWHSLCLQVIREDRTEWADWQIDDKDAHKWAVKDAIGFKNLKWTGADLGKVRSFITVCKANLWTWESEQAMQLAIRRFGTVRDASGRPAYQLALDAFKVSQGLIEEKKILTFDDFLVFVHRHLCDESARARWASRWDYVICDEVQDNNVAQCEIAKMLAKDHGNYQIVGDYFQSLYSFRGSDPKLFAAFPGEWPGAKVVSVMRNYRSGSKIIAAANAVIRSATDAKPTEMIAERGIEGDVRTVRAHDFDDEAEEVGRWAEALHKNGELGTGCVLFRLNAQSRALEESLLRREIPYVIVGGTSFYERKEVKDLLAYLRVAVGQDREGDGVKRCINAPFRFLGAAFVDRVTKVADSRSGDQDWASVVREAASGAGVQGRQRQSAEEWAKIVEEVHRRTGLDGDARRPSEILDWLVRTTGYIEWIKREEGEETVEQSGGANVQELIRVSAKFQTVEKLLAYIEQNIKLAKRQRRDRQAGGDRLLLMSVHKSKGLEFPRVWVVGCNEQILPHAKGDIEEERRIMYVAMTRARDSLTMSYTANIVMRTGVRDGVPSRFLRDAGLLAGVVGGDGEEEIQKIESMQV